MQPLLGWGEEGQTSAAVMSSLAMVGRPSGDARSGSPRLEALLGGIAQGLEALCEPSPIQVKSKGLTQIADQVMFRMYTHVKERGVLSTEGDWWSSLHCRYGSLVFTLVDVFYHVFIE